MINTGTARRRAVGHLQRRDDLLGRMSAIGDGPNPDESPAQAIGPLGISGPAEAVLVQRSITRSASYAFGQPRTTNWSGFKGSWHMVEPSEQMNSTSYASSGSVNLATTTPIAPPGSDSAGIAFSSRTVSLIFRIAPHLEINVVRSGAYSGPSAFHS